MRYQMLQRIWLIWVPTLYTIPKIILYMGLFLASLPVTPEQCKIIFYYLQHIFREYSFLYVLN